MWDTPAQTGFSSLNGAHDRSVPDTISEHRFD
jgi:hypothetical protein